MSKFKTLKVNTRGKTTSRRLFTKRNKDRKQDNEIKKLKRQVKILQHGKKTKNVVQKFTPTNVDYSSIYTTDKKLYYFPSIDINDNPSYAYDTPMIQGRDADKISLLRTKIHLKMELMLPGTRYRIMLINVLDSALDIDSVTDATTKAGMFIKYAGYDSHSGLLINRDVPEMLINSPINYKDIHKFKVLSDNVYTAPNIPGNLALDTNNSYQYVTKYHTININHLKKGDKTGLDLEFPDQSALSDKNRLHLFLYTNQDQNSIRVTGYSEQFYQDVSS